MPLAEDKGHERFSGCAGAFEARLIDDADHRGAEDPRYAPLRLSRLRTLERDDVSSSRHPALPLLFAHDLFRKPVATFRDHALAYAACPACASTSMSRPLRPPGRHIFGYSRDISAIRYFTGTSKKAPCSTT